jgi:opacity protein-like surface antigen
MLNGGPNMIYALVGYTQSDWQIDATKLDKSGLVLGGGIEFVISKHVSLIAEYTQTGFGSIAPDPMLKLEPVNHTARLGLSYRFNGLFGE